MKIHRVTFSECKQTHKSKLIKIPYNTDTCDDIIKNLRKGSFFFLKQVLIEKCF